MDVSLAARPKDLGYSAAAIFQPPTFERSASPRANDAAAALVSFSFADVYKSLSITAQEALQRLQNFVEKSSDAKPVEPPQGPLTPQRTADLITEGVVAAYRDYVAAGTTEESPEKFADAARAELAEAFESARGTLQSNGSLTNPDVAKSFSETKKAVDSAVTSFISYIAEQS